MRNFITSFRYAIAVFVVVVLAALAWWYFMLSAQTHEIALEDASRGSSSETPSFKSRVGSTYENIVTSASSFQREGGSAPETLGRLAQISTTPTAGAGFVAEGTSTSVRFVERSTGYVLEASVADGSLTRLTNTLLPRTYKAIVGEESILMQTLEESGVITTVVGVVSAASSSETSVFISTKRLPDGIRTIAISPREKEVAYLRSGESGEVVGVKRDIASGKEKQIFSSLVSGWRLEWLPNGRMMLHQDPSSDAAGYVYEILESGVLQPLMRNVRGLTLKAHPSSRALFFGNAESDSLFARINDQASTITLPIRTVPEKCVWNPGKNLVAFCAVPQSLSGPQFLDRWYRGEVHTTDAWWRVDVSAGTAELLYSPGDRALDVEEPVIDASGTYITFLDARDKSLWLLQVREQ